VRMVASLDEIDLANETRDIFICGGAQIYAQTLAQCSDLYLTLVKRDVEGDAFFPRFEDDFELREVISETPEFRILHYVNRNFTTSPSAGAPTRE
jgi:dihydrofolate reductase